MLRTLKSKYPVSYVVFWDLIVKNDYSSGAREGKVTTVGWV